MKLRYIVLILLSMIWLWEQTVFGQELDLSFSAPESGTQTHQARNSISLLPGYSYTPGGNGMIAEIVNPIVNGSISYAYTPVDPHNRSLNTSYLVGATRGTFDVNAIGGANYTIPIDVLPGVSGLTPSLSLVYSSNSGPGVVGYGWQIGGLSVISRSPQTYYHDGTSIGVNLTSSDRFSLDGQRLICVAGSYGADNSEYRTEIDNFSKIVCLTDGSSTPKRFLVKTKSGETIEYGYEADSDQTIAGLTGEVSWYVNKRTDLYGNTIEYEYLKQYGHNYIGEIKYGPNTVSFYYKERSDKQTSYFLGGTLQQNLILDKIEIKYYSTLVKKYELIYYYNNAVYGGTTVLNELVEYGISGSRYNSTAFSYEYPTGDCNNNPYLENNSYISTNYTQYRGDYNGDGRDDIFTVDNSNRKSWRLYHATINGGFSYITSGTTTFDIVQAIPTDLNGDGRDDLMLRRFVDSGPYNGVVSDQYTFYYAICNGNSIQTPQYFTSEFYALSTLTGVKIENSILENNPVDFDGDGLEDILIRTFNSWKVFGFTYNGSSLTFSQKISGTGVLPGDKLFFGDFNGDGKTDLYSFDANGLRIYAVNGSTLSLLKTDSTPKSGHHFRLGDFNGDGKTDIFVYGYTTDDWSLWQMRLSTGAGFQVNDLTRKKTNLKDDVVYTGDFNGDGRTDILALSKNTSNNPRQYYFVTKPNATDMNSEYYERSEYNKDQKFTLGDFDGNGQTDILVTASSSTYYRGLQDDQTNILLSGIGDGLNNTTSISYRKLNGPYSNYTIGSSETVFPVFTYMGPLNVVNDYWTNGGSPSHPSYTYKGFKIHRQGKGAIGYEQIIVDDTQKGIKTETNSGYDATSFYPTILSAINYMGGVKTSETKNTWDKKITVSGSGRVPVFPYVQSSTQTDLLTGHLMTTIATYDSYGNPTQIVKNYNNAVSEKTVNNYTNTVSSTDWKIGRLDNSTITYSKWSGEPSVSHTVRYTYDVDGIMKPDFVYYNEGTPLEYSKNHDYNTQGNLIQVHTYGASIGASQVNFTYDTDLIRVKTSTNELGHVTTFNYNSYGQLQTEVDYLNNTNTYAYDEMGRQSLVSSTLGSQTTTTYVWTGTYKPSSGLYGVTQSGNDGSASTTWYDKLGRAIRLEKKGFGGQMILTDTEYNDKGQVYRISDPYFAGGSVVWAETYTYDGYGRITNISRSTGRNTTYAYSSNRVTETTAGKTTWKETDSQGLVTAAHDNGGDIVYTYYPDGKVKTITAPGNVVTRMQYADAARNQTQLNDPSAGIINYSYNSLGQIKTQTNARSQQTTYNYYDDGRVNTVVTPEGTTIYSYNTNKQLTGITSPSSVSRTYGYDAKGRVNSVDETIAGSDFSTSFTYDSFGRLSTRTHPSGIVETLGYNSYGYLSTISAGGSTRYTLTSMNAREQLTGATYGSNLAATYGFDAYGYPASNQAGSVQDYRYVFDPVTGNLSSRQNYKRGLYESFSYTGNGDNLDRLTGVTGPQPLDMTYDANGNIKTKSDISSTVNFGYGTNAGPYALTEVSSSTGVIPTNPQTATYTSFEKVATIAEGNYNAAMVYNSDNQRAKMDVTQSGSSILTRWYAGSSYMKETAGGVTREYTYIGGDAYTAPVAAVTQGGTTTYYYLLRDYLGNITHQVNTSNAVVAEYNFDAWGRRRSADDWSYTLDANDKALFADRGFTAHEHLPWFSLVNMNGRLYDPLVGRFLNVDPYVQMPDYTQNFNRYSYCLNNPLKYKDSDGEWFFSLIFPGVGTVIDVFLWSATIDYATQVVTNYVTNKDGSASNWFWKNIDWLDVGISGVAAVATMGLDNVYKSHKISKPLFKAGKVAIDFGLPALSAHYDWTPASDKEKFSVNKGSDFWTEYAFTVVKQKVATKNTDEIIDGLFGDKPWILNNPLKGELWKKALDIPASVFFGWWSDKATQPEPQIPTQPQIPNPNRNPEWKQKNQNSNQNGDQDNLYQISNSLKLSF